MISSGNLFLNKYFCFRESKIPKATGSIKHSREWEAPVLHPVEELMLCSRNGLLAHGPVDYSLSARMAEEHLSSKTNHFPEIPPNM